MKKRDFIRAGAAGTLALGGASLAQAQTGPTYSWKMATGWPGGPLMDIGSKAFAERMALLSGGRFKIQTFPGGALGNALKVPDTVRNGLAEVRSHLDGLGLGQGPHHGPVRRLRRQLRHRADAALDLPGRRQGVAAQVSPGERRHRLDAAVHPHRRSLRAFAQAGQVAGRSQGPQDPHRRCMAGDGQGPRRGPGHHRRAATSTRCSSAAPSMRWNGGRCGRTSRWAFTRSPST